MATFNCEKFISSAIESIMLQSFNNWQLIIVDDGSTDCTLEIVKSFIVCDKRVQYYYQDNRGQGSARNLGIKYATAELVAFIDADDIWEPKKLELQISLINSTNADLVFSDVFVINELGTKVGETWMVDNKYYTGSDGILDFLDRNRIPFSSVMVRKFILLTNTFDSKNMPQYGEDYDLWLRLLQKGYLFLGSSEKLASYRRHSLQTTSSSHNMIQVVKRLNSLEFNDRKITNRLKISILLWIRRCIKANQSNFKKKDMKELIELYPHTYLRHNLKFCNRVFNIRVMILIMYAITKIQLKKFKWL